MPQLLVAAAAALASWGASAAATAAGATLFGLSVATTATIIGSVVGLVVAMAGSMLLSSLAPKPKLPDFSQDRKQAVRSGIEPVRIAYGRSMVSGPIVYMGSFGSQSEYIQLVMVVAGHPIEAFEEVWINSTRIVLAAPGVGGHDALDRAGGALGGTIRIHTYDGTQTAAAGALVTDNPSDWTSDHKLLGVAYIYVRVKYDPKHIDNFATMSAVIRGKKVWDPRTNTTGYSNNAALCILDYLLSLDGIKADPTDEIEESFWEAAANICDEDVALNAGSTLLENRYELNGSFKLDQTPIDIMTALLSSCGGTLTYVGGRYRLHVAAYVSPTVALDESDFAGDIRVQPAPPRRSVINRVDGTYIAEAQQWSAVSIPPVIVPAFETEDGEVIANAVEFPYVTSRTQAERLARLSLLRARRGLTVEVPLKLSGQDITVWSMISLTVADLGWSSKAFRVQSWRFDPVTSTIRITAQEELASSYTWLYSDAGPDLSDAEPTLVLPTDIVAPTNLTLTATTSIQGDGGTVPALLVTWDPPPNPYATSTEVQWKISSSSDWSAIEVPAPGAQAVLAPLLSGASYNVRVRARAALRVSDWTSTVTDTAAADTTAPSVPTSVAATATSIGIAITWTKPTAPDLVAVEVWENTSSSTSGRYFVGETSGERYVRSGLGGNVTRHYWVRARDRSGNTSAFSSSVSATTTQIVTGDVTQYATFGLRMADAVDTMSITNNNMTSVSTKSIVVPDGASVVINWVGDLAFVALPGDSGDGGHEGGGDVGGGDT